jgi:hypothetical protein
MTTINCSAIRNEVQVFPEVGRRHLPDPVQEPEAAKLLLFTCGVVRRKLPEGGLPCPHA